VIVAVSLVAGAACETARSSPPQQVTQVVDSTLPREETLRRFRAGIPPVTELENAASSREELVRTYVHGLQQSDTVALARLALTKAEFAWLYYETNPQALPPYDLSPALMWFMTEEAGNKGLHHAIEERGGRPLQYAGHDCKGEVSIQGSNRVWGPCVVRWVLAVGYTVEQRLFGPIIERQGRYKLVSHANRL
jgi:hypothetical protein